VRTRFGHRQASCLESVQRTGRGCISSSSVLAPCVAFVARRWPPKRTRWAIEAANHLWSVLLAVFRPSFVASGSLGAWRSDDDDRLHGREEFARHRCLTRRGPKTAGLRVVVAQILEMFLDDGTRLEWIDNSLMLADAMTKKAACPEYIMDALARNKWSDVVSEEAKQFKDRVRASLISACSGLA